MIAEARVNAFHDRMQAAGPSTTRRQRSALRAGRGARGAPHSLPHDADHDAGAERLGASAAEATRARVTAANFAQLAGQTNDDPTAKQQGGDLGVFPRGAMVKEFEQAVLASSRARSRRSSRRSSATTSSAARRTPRCVVRSARRCSVARRRWRDSTFVANLEAGANVQLEDDAAAVARAVVADLDGHREDKTVLATTKIGNFTAEKFGRWVRMFPAAAASAASDRAGAGLDRPAVREKHGAQRAHPARGRQREGRRWIRSSSRSFAARSRRSSARRGRSSASRPRSCPTARRPSRSASGWRPAASNRTSIGCWRIRRSSCPCRASFPSSCATRTSGRSRALASSGPSSGRAGIRATRDSTRAASRPQSQVPLGPTQPGDALGRTAAAAGAVDPAAVTGTTVPRRGVPRVMIRFMLAAALALLAASAAQAARSRRRIPVDRVVAVVGNEVILWSDVLEEINVMRAQGRELPNDSAAQMAVAREIIERLVETELLVQRASQDSTCRSRTPSSRRRSSSACDRCAGSSRRRSSSRTCCAARGLARPRSIGGGSWMSSAGTSSRSG